MPYYLGMQIKSGNYLPIIKYDARSGRLVKVDKDAFNQSVPSDIGPDVRFAIDLASLETGALAFTAGGPVRKMAPLGQPAPPCPDDVNDQGQPLFRPGFYVKVAGRALGGLREWSSNTAILLGAIDALWHEFAAAPEAAAGKIPLVSLTSTTPVSSGSGARKSTNYRPVFTIVGWVERMPEMGERTVPAPRPAAAQALQAQPAQAPAPVHAPQQPVPAASQMAVDEMPF